MKGKYLVNTDDWFMAPDGQSYKAAWGKVEILEDSIIGIKTNRNSTNWYLKVGSEEDHIIIAGCQVHHLIKCDKKPKSFNHKNNEMFEGKSIVVDQIPRIYFAQ